MIISNNIDKNAQIAFFDSGVGGLTVLNKVKKILPNESFIYYGDTLHMPYGEKTKEQLLDYSDKIFKFFEAKGCKAVVMACNTTSSVIYDSVKDKYNLIVFPIVQSVAKILSQLPINKLGIFATRATISSMAYQNEIAKYNPNMKVYGQHCPDWVHIVEENTMNTAASREIIKNDFEKMMKNSPDKIVLGCTHYPFLLGVLSELANQDLFIDPAIPFADYIKDTLAQNNLLCNSKLRFEEFYVSSNPENFKNSSCMFYELSELPQLLTF